MRPPRLHRACVALVWIAALAVGVPAQAQEPRPSPSTEPSPPPTGDHIENTITGEVVPVEGGAIAEVGVGTGDLHTLPGSDGGQGTGGAGTTQPISTGDVAGPVMRNVWLGPYPADWVAGCPPDSFTYTEGRLDPTEFAIVDSLFTTIRPSSPEDLDDRLTRLGLRDAFSALRCRAIGGGVPVIRAQDIRAAVRRFIPEPAVQISPRDRGAAQLDTWLWHDRAFTLPAVTVAVPASDGRVVSGTASFVLTEVCWQLTHADDPEPSPAAPCTYRSSSRSTEDDPAATHVYPSNGRERVSVTTRWAVAFSTTAVVTWPGTVPVDLTTHRAYDVIEIRSVLTN